MRIAVTLALVVMLTGCTSITPKYYESAVARATPGSRAIVIRRGRHFGIDNVPLVIFLDGRPVAHVGGGQTITLHVADGRHSIGVAPKAAEDRGPSSSITVDVSAQNQPVLITNVAWMGWAGWKIEREE